MGAQPALHVGGGGDDAPRGGDRRQIPRRHRKRERVVTACGLRIRLVEDGNSAVAEAQRRQDPLRDQIGIAAPGGDDERVPEQGDAEVRVSGHLAQARARPRPARRRLQAPFVEAPIGVGGLQDRWQEHLPGHSRQSGRVGGEVEQRHLLAGARGGDAREVLDQAVIERELAAKDHVGEDRGGERLRHRADLKARGSVERAVGPGRPPGIPGAVTPFVEHRNRPPDAPADQASNRIELRCAAAIVAAAPGDHRPVRDADQDRDRRCREQERSRVAERVGGIRTAEVDHRVQEADQRPGPEQERPGRITVIGR